jgi:site-specific recombinase XerD
MNDLISLEEIAQWQKLKTHVLDSVSSPITKRVYNMALDEFMGWFQQAPRQGFTKATVSAWRVSLEDRRLDSSSIIIRMSAIRKLAAEAADNGLLAPELAAGISRVKSAKTQGIRVGNWLSLRQAQALLSAPDITTVRGLRDRAILAVLLGCGLRRSEVAALAYSHLQQRDWRWCIVDLVGKHGRVQTAPMPTWVKVAIDAWTSPAGVSEGYVFRAVNRADRVARAGLPLRSRAFIGPLEQSVQNRCYKFPELLGFIPVLGEVDQIERLAFAVFCEHCYAESRIVH